jgi:hypothetical protein
MTQRERMLTTGVLALVALAGAAFLFNLFFLGPLAERGRAIETLRADVARKQERVDQIRGQKAKLDQWRHASLPGDTDQEEYASTRRRYTNYLHQLLQDANLATTSLRILPQKPDTKGVPLLPGKKPIYTKLTFTVDAARGNLGAIVQMLDRFYHAGLLHQVKKLSIQRPRTLTPDQQPDDLNVSLTVEALVVNGTEPRSTLNYVDRRGVVLDTSLTVRGGPSVLGLALCTIAAPGGPLAPTPLAQPARHYADLAARNPFYPSDDNKHELASDITQFVYLTDITTNAGRTEASLYDRGGPSRTRLRASAGFDRFRVLDSKGNPVLNGKVIRIEARDVYFQVDGKYYAIHLGQSLEEALRKPLSESKAKELQAVAVVP